MASTLTKRALPVALIVAALAIPTSPAACATPAPSRVAASVNGEAAPLKMVVMDPLSDRLACDCVAGYAQRKYDRLGAYLEKRLGRRVEIAYAEALASPPVRKLGRIDLIVGKYSEVVFDAGSEGLDVRSIAMLSGAGGELTQTGLFIVRQADAARSIEDLKGYQLLFGPEEADEKRAAARSTLEAFNVPIPEKIAASPGCSTAALAVVEKDADAAVVSGYAMPLLKGCGAIEPGELRVVGRTDPVPFIGVFATATVTPATERQVVQALSGLRAEPGLLAAMESKYGFVPLPPVGRRRGKAASTWADWRGPGRRAHSPDVPPALPARKTLLWSRTMTGAGMSGLAVDGRHVVAADKDLREEMDIFRCLDADTGRQIWKLAYPAAGKMDFTNSPRAAPVIVDDLVYLLGAFGDLHCVKLGSGRVVWRKSLMQEFGVKRPTWGTCSAPLVVGEKLIVNPGAPDASIVALDRRTGKVLWQTPGVAPGYAGFILAKLGGVEQIVGYDAISLGGWDPQTGRRLWQLVPELEGDFNVPTPLAVDGRLLVATENNGTRLYGFDEKGVIRPEPIAANEDFAPDTSTPVVLDGLVFGSFAGLFCLDLKAGLKTLWETDEDPYADYCTFIAGNGRVLVMTQSGKLRLLKTDKSGLKCVGSLDLFDDVPDTERDVWSHPALVGNRLYVRNLLGVYCFLLK